MRDLEGATAARERYIQEEIARLLARERDLWQREREAHAIAMEKERERAISSKLRLAYFMGALAF